MLKALSQAIRGRVGVEVLGAALLGTVGLGFHQISNWASGAESDPHLITRVSHILSIIVSPGIFVGPFFGAGAEEAIGVIANCFFFGVAWSILRVKPKTSDLRRLVLAVGIVWLLVATPFAIFSSLWMVL